MRGVDRRPVLPDHPGFRIGALKHPDAAGMPDVNAGLTFSTTNQRKNGDHGKTASGRDRGLGDGASVLV